MDQVCLLTRIRKCLAPLSGDRKLRVGAAVGTREDDKQRVQRLHREGDVDVVILDSSQGMQQNWRRLMLSSLA